MVVADQDGRIVAANSSYQELTGYSEQELLNFTLFDLTQNEGRQANRKLPAQPEPNLREFEARFCRKDGQLIWVRHTVSGIPGSKISTPFILATAEDITKRRLVEDNLKQQNEALQKIFDHVPVMINFTSADGLITLVNREWERTLGWTLKEIRNNDFDIFAECYPDPEYRRHILEFVADAKGEWADFKTRTKDGRVIDTRWAVVKLNDGNTIGIGADISRRKQAEDALRRSEAYLAESQRLSHVGTWAWSAITEEILFWSAEHYRIFGFDPNADQVSLDKVRERIHPDDRGAFDGIRAAMSSDKSDFAVDLRLVLPDGAIKQIHSIGHPVFDEGGGLVEFTGAVMDVTERKRGEDELQRSLEQLRALAARLQSAREEERKRVARAIHDELGHALTAIRIDLSFLLHALPPQQTQQSKRAQSILKVVDQTIQAVRRISTDLRPGILDDLGLIAALEWAAEEYEARTGIRCQLSLPANAGLISTEHATAIFRIFQETLTNIARHANATRVDICLAREPKGLMLEVRDNGRGIREEELSAADSLGILGIRERALLLGGELLIQGFPQSGTIVRIWIPSTDAA